MSIDISYPAQGRVDLVLSWQDAEMLCRALGLVNTGNLRTMSPELYKVVGDLVEVFGRNTEEEANKYIAEIRGQQVYIVDDEPYRNNDA